MVKHPLFGVIVGLVAWREIRRGEEILVNYHYDRQAGPLWYREGYRRYLDRVTSYQEL